MFIGRKEELEFLESRYRAAEAQLVVLYGRRRVGKTETLKQFCEGKSHVFYACTECTDSRQLRAFSERMLKKEIPASKYIRTFSDWEQAFLSIKELPGDEKKLLVIDEFPYMVRGNPSIPSILQNLWDGFLKKENIMLVLCGSAMAFIEKEILSEKNPLYGRATGILRMKELSFYEAIQFFPGYSSEDKMTAYAILGGIPHYLKQFDPGLTLGENIKRNILERGSILYSEVEFLMRQELRETAVYNTVIGAVALGNTKMNDIHGKTQIDKNKLTVYLKNLADLGIVEREFSVSDGVKIQSGVQRGLYRISDCFFRFWYAFVFPNLSELETGDAEGIYTHAVAPDLVRYTSYIFETVCREYLRRQNRQNKLPFHFTRIGRWWNGGIELDVLASDTSGENLIIGECKYRKNAFSKADLDALLCKYKPQKNNAEVIYWLFSKSRFTDDVLKIANDKGIRTTDLDEIVHSF